jgi:DNA replication protein DnaC
MPLSKWKPEDKDQTVELQAQARRHASQLAWTQELSEVKDRLVKNNLCKLVQEAGSVNLLHADISSLQELKSRFVKCLDIARERNIGGEEMRDAERCRRRFHQAIQDLKGHVRVCCRVRKLNDDERNKNEAEVVHVLDDMTLKVDGAGAFTFDSVFSPGTQCEVFDECRDMVQSAVDGRNATIFTYGQTGAGKTYTMFGADGLEEADEGVAFQTVSELFSIVDRLSEQRKIVVKASVVELYNNRLVDLSKPQACKGKADTIDDSESVEHIGKIEVRQASELKALLRRGLRRRATAAHAMNRVSSRSHLIFSIDVLSVCNETGESLSGKILLCDLGGAERIKRTGVEGARQKEAIEINKSLTALGNVIEAVAKKQKRIPYRDHKLTQFMQDSLGGTAKVTMLVNCSPASADAQQTMMSLKYASRVKQIVNAV